MRLTILSILRILRHTRSVAKRELDIPAALVCVQDLLSLLEFWEMRIVK